MKIVILDGYTVTQDDLNWDDLQRETGAKVTVHPRTKAEDTVERCHGAEAVLTNKVVMSREIIAQLPSLRYIGVLATGYNVVDIEAARERGITVTNIPAYSTDSVAQMVFALLLHVTNQVAHYAEENRRGRWAKGPDFLWTDTPLTELSGKTMAIRGMGNIGTRVAQIALALDMRVLAVTARRDLPAGVERVGWEQALTGADVLSLHCPLTDETYHLINERALSLISPDAILINTGRGSLVDEDAVAEALWDGRLGAYCADVLSTEPPQRNNSLLAAPRCYLTPHIAWATREARQRLIRTAVGNLQAFMAGRPVNVVNA